MIMAETEAMAAKAIHHRRSGIMPEATSKRVREHDRSERNKHIPQLKEKATGQAKEASDD